MAWLLNAASAEGVLDKSAPVGRDVWNQRIDRDLVTGEFQPTGGLYPILDWMPATLHPLVRATIRLQGAPLARATTADSYEYANEGSMLALPAGYSKYYMGSLYGPEINNPYSIPSHAGDFMVYAKGISSWADVAASASEAELRATDTGGGLMALSGSGSASQPYIISSPEALAWFAYQVNTKNADSIANMQAAGGSDPAFTAAPGLAYGAAHARLGADIDLTGPAGGTSATPLPWVPIGWESAYTGTSVYTGSFDGKGHTIDHMWVGTDGEAGLFGRTGSGTIANLALGTNSSVRIDAPYAIASKHAAGGLVAVSDGTHIEGCLSGASVTANLGVRGTSGAANEATVGGLVGVFTKPGSIKQSANTGAVSSEEGVPGAPTRLGLGGLVGDDAQSGGGTSIDGCFNSGAVTIAVSYGDLSFAGGLVGKAFVPGNLTEVPYRGTTVTDSYNTGAIAVSSSAGSSVSGLSVDTVFPVGRTRYADAAAIASRAVSNVLTLDAVVGAEVGSMGGVSGAGTVTNLLGAKSVSAGQLNTWGAAYELNGGATGGTAGDGAVATMDKWGILSGASSPMPVIQGSTAAAASMPAASSWEDVGSWVDNFDPVDEHGNKFKPNLLASDGSAALKSIQLGSAEALAWMACKVNYDNGGKPAATSTLTYGTSFYQLTDDVSLAGTKYTDGTARLDWLGIGSLGSPFGGAFAGGSHAVDGLSVVSTRNYQGFFGYMSAPEGAAEKASVHDLSLSGSVSGGECVGGLLGQGVNVRLSNLSVRVDVTGSDNVGGVVGRLETSSEGSAVSHTGTVGATVGCAGGFVGNSVSTVLTDVSHVGSVSAPDKAGGIGAVYGSFRSCSLTNAYVAGTVKVNAGGLSYALVGDTYNTNLANCYFDEAAGPSLAHPTSGMASATNVEAKTADEFASGEVAWLLDTASTNGATTGNAHRNVWGQNVGRNADGQLDATAGDAYPVAGVSAAHPCVLKIDQAFDAAFPGEAAQTTYASAGSKVKLAVATDESKKLKYVLAGNELGDDSTGETTIKSPYTVHASRTADLSITAKNGAVFDSWESLATAVDTGQTVTMLDGTPRNMGEYKNIDGAGTAADPYQIDSPEAFAWWAFKKASNTATSHAVLTQGISLFGNDYVDAAPGPDAKNVDGNDGADGIPDNIREALPWPGTASLGEYPGSGSNTGSLDGGGNAVSHLYVASGDGGLFRSVAAGAVRNLVMDAGLVDSDGYAAGSVAAVATNSVFVNVANESVEVRKVGAADDIRGAGGLVGYTGGAGTIATFVNCANKADVSSGKHAGGIIGAADAGGTFYLCSNEGDVSGTSAGGLTSNIGSDACNGFVEACSNTGAIASTAGAAAGLACADRFASFKNSYSAAAVTAAGGTAYALADAGTLTDCYFDQDAFRSATTPGASGATAKTSDEMKAPGFAADLNVALSASATQSEGVALNKYQWMQAADGNTNKGYPYTAARVYADWGDVGADQTETTLRASGALTGGKGANESDAVVINSPEALAWLAKQVNSGGDIFAGGSEGYMAIKAYVKLGADLSLKGTKASGAVDDYVAADHRGLPWVSMGTSSYPFQGTFDGCGHEVDYVTVAEGGSPEGFFGYVSGTVKNMGIGANSKMTSGGTSASIAGALVQRLQGGTVDGCWNKGDVSLTGNKVGGLIGQASGTLKNSWNEGSVSCSNQYAGGLVGLVGRGDDLVVENCYNKGNLSNSNTIAGLVTAESGATVRFSNCYNAGEVRAGNASALYVNDAGNAAGATFTNCYYEEGKVVYVDPQDATAAGLTSMTAAQLKSWGAAYQLNGGAAGGTAGDGNVANMSTWTFDVANPGYPEIIARDASGVATAAMSKAGSWSDVGLWVETFNPSTSAPLEKFKPAGDGSTGAFDAVANTGPYQITNPEGLAWFAYMVGSQPDAYRSKSVELVSDINLEGAAYGGYLDVPASGADAFDAYKTCLPWDPIGGVSYGAVRYAGSFDGGGHDVLNMRIDGERYGSTYTLGIFGFLEGAAVRNLTLKSGLVQTSTSVNYSGAIAGNVDGAHLSDVVNEGVRVLEGYCTGGLVGNAGGASSTFERCGNETQVTCGTAYQYTGGLVGRVEAGGTSFVDCANAGEVSGASINGGIVGYCATGDVAFASCLNTGRVATSGRYAGNFLGDGSSGITLANCYYLQGACAPNGFEGASVAKTADEFASGEVAWLLDTASANGATTGGPHRNVWGQKVGRDATTGELAAGGDAYPAFLDAAVHPRVLALTQDFDNGVFGDDTAEPSQTSYANAGSMVKLAVPTDSTKKIKYVLAGNEEGNDSAVETTLESPYLVHASRATDLAIAVKTGAVFESWAKLADAVDAAPGTETTLTDGTKKDMSTFKPTGAGTVDDPYQLSTPEAFAWWAFKKGGHAKLTANISLFGDNYVGATPGALDADGIPGNIKNALPWTGTTVGTNMDGGNFTITHLYGTTGLLSEAVDLRNLTLAEGLVDATGQTNAQVGAFASTSSDTNAVFVNLTNQSVAVFGSGDSSNGYAGGIAGSSVGTPSFVNCTNRAPVSSAHWTGGILGGMKGLPDTVAPQFYLCSNEADIDVSSTAYSIGGGIAGSAYKGDMEACSNTGAISAAGDCAGLVVSEPALTGRNCYNAGAVSGATYSNDQFGGGTYQDSYYNSAFAAPTLGGGTPKSSDEMKDAAFAADLDRVLVQSTTEVAGIKLARYQWMYDSTVNSGYPHIAERPIANWGDAGAAQDEAKLRLTYWDNATSAWMLAANASAVPSGMAALEGTAAAGFTIRSEEALAWFGAQVNAGATGFASANVTLAAAGSHTAFDLAGTTYGFDVTAGGADDKAKYSTCLPWVPIGSEANPFTGTLRAYGTPVQNLYIGEVSDDVHGLFGTVDGATLLGIEVSDGYVFAKELNNFGFAGAIAGQTRGTVVLEDCHNAATVRGASVGGLVGRALSGNLTVRTSANEGKVEIQGGQPIGGGLVGFAGATVQVFDSYNVGTVEGDWSVGGLIGILQTPASASFDRCFSAGSLIDKYNSGQTGAFTSTKLDCPITIGEGCYYDSDVIAGTQDAASVTALTTAQLKTWGAAYQLNGGAAGGAQTGNIAGMSTWTWTTGNYPTLIARNAAGAATATMSKPADWSDVGVWVDTFNPLHHRPAGEVQACGCKRALHHHSRGTGVVGVQSEHDAG